jgi:tRNA(Ile)-lysidine synthase
MAHRPETPDGLLAHAGARLARVREGDRICLAFSGGLDSSVLLDLLARLRGPRRFALAALHVHHGLSPRADEWAAFCERAAARLAVPLRIERVHVDREDARGLEAAARAARYAALSREQAKFVALAHHLDDQAETVLLQALRGAGLKGISAMGEAKVVGAATWLRPLLRVPREALQRYAQARSLEWVEDESNELTAFDRNFLRHEALPMLARRFPQLRESLARLARHAASADELLESLGREDAGEDAMRAGLAVERLRALAPVRQANALRQFLAAHTLAMPSEARLADMLRQILSSRDDARVLLPHDDRALVRHQGRIMVDELPRAEPPWTVRWRGERVIALGAGRGEVRFADSDGPAIDLARTAEPAWRIAPRAGGERLRLDPSRPTRTLKNLLQEHRVPVWRRGELPLLFHGEQLVWVPGIGIACDYRAAPGKRGLEPAWVPAAR